MIRPTRTAVMAVFANTLTDAAVKLMLEHCKPCTLAWRQDGLEALVKPREARLDLAIEAFDLFKGRIDLSVGMIALRKAQKLLLHLVAFGNELRQFLLGRSIDIEKLLRVRVVEVQHFAQLIVLMLKDLLQDLLTAFGIDSAIARLCDGACSN